ncbi:MAG: hypothetical protein P4K86_08845 [Terracidiphilus sp.]|nr:hypothetical protein [Terracidiphilus sp.]
MNRRTQILILIVLVALPIVTVQACGPEFYPDVFVRKMRPDDPKEFAKGKLGVLLPTYPRTDLIVAYRYLNGGALTPAEQAGYSPTETYYSEEEWSAKWQLEGDASKKYVSPAERWRSERAAFVEANEVVGQDRELHIRRADGSTVSPDYQNCADDAFLNAVAVLQARAKTWGAKSPDLIDWIHGQDAVFANCRGGDVVTPADTPGSSSTLLRQDRVYQKAAALFYQARFDEAAQAFETIGRDEQSPWHGRAKYLVTRALVRKAFLSANSNIGDRMAEFDSALMKQAQSAIESLLRETGTDVPRSALRKELDFVRLRTAPNARAHELSAALAGPKTDPNYAQHLTDLTWYLDANLDNRAVREDADVEAFLPMNQLTHGDTPTQKQRIEQFEKTYHDLAEFRASAPLVDWLITLQSPAEEARNHAILEWKKTGHLAWLVAALCKATAQDQETGDLVRAAGLIPEESPAWETTNYHRIRLLTGSGRSKEARALLSETSPRIQARRRDSSLNLYQGLRMRSAVNLDEALAFAPRKILNRASEQQASLDECLGVMKDPRRKYNCKNDTGYAEFNADAASLFNLETPLSVIAEAAASPKLPENLRRSLAIMAWVRAVLTTDDATAAKVFSALPEKIQQQAGTGTGFKPLVTLVRNPGLRPYLDPGVQRSYSFDFIESYRDNWWCKEWGLSWWGNAWQQRGHPNEGLLRSDEAAAFLTPAQKSEGERQSSQLRSTEDAEIVLGQRALAYVKDHPTDPDIPESLYLVLRMIRYSCAYDYGADTPEHKQMTRQVDEISRTAARILRQRYPTSPWTKKAAPFVG